MFSVNSDSIMKSIEDAHQMFVKLVNRNIGSEEIPQHKEERSEESIQKNQHGFDEIA